MMIRVILAVLVFSAFKSIDFMPAIVNTFIDFGWSLLLILLVIVSIRTAFAGVGVLAVLPRILGFKSQEGWLREYLRFDLKVTLLGVLSFIVFCTLAALISLSMGIYQGNPSMVFAFPDIRPEPDVIGWGYFLVALVPGIWEELAFRGLIQSKLRKVFSSKVSILLSATFFGLFHFTSMVSQAPLEVIPGVIMAFFFGLAWGVMTVKARSVIPAIISHYLVDSMGQVFLNVDNSNLALSSGFFILLTLTFPVFSIILTRIIYKETVPTA